jgi:hypothetical protein
VAVALTTGVLVAAESAASPRSATAPGGPGAQAYLDLARKDCFGTAPKTTSKVWFTVADGVLSDTFSPTIENSNVNTLQYIVTDGRSFTDLQQRDMTYTVSAPDRSGMVCQVTSRDPKHEGNQGDEWDAYVTLGRTTGTNAGSPAGREPHGDGVLVVVVGATTHQGGRESRPQGQGAQVAGHRSAARYA